MLVDADHLLATPIFDPDRCSIGYHPLHSYYAIVLYFVLLFFPKTRIIAVGLLFHMFTDWQDCQWALWLGPPLSMGPYIMVNPIYYMKW